ncbi:MAG: CHAT domain-containing protein [Calothrix sp. MO_192.B10]|nr:CHAT domain-containing protein [Calothrix sp. MO_192.B10]
MLKVLLLSAIPHGLRLDTEMREIEDTIRRAARRDLFDISTRNAVRPQDIRRAIAEEQPQFVHFCGHGLEDGSLLLEDDGGKNKPVSSQGLATLFNLHRDYVQCVLLNACHDYAIGMNQEIQDKAAIAFAQGFYDGLGYDVKDTHTKLLSKIVFCHCDGRVRAACRFATQRKEAISLTRTTMIERNLVSGCIF